MAIFFKRLRITRIQRQVLDTAIWTHRAACRHRLVTTSLDTKIANMPRWRVQVPWSSNLHVATAIESIRIESDYDLLWFQSETKCLREKEAGIHEF